MNLFDKLFKSEGSKDKASVECADLKLHFDHEGIHYQFFEDPQAISNGIKTANESITDQARRLAQLATDFFQKMILLPS